MSNNSKLAMFTKASDNVQKNFIQAQEKKKYDEGFWKLTLDGDAQVAAAVIRFLPQSDPNELPYVTLGQHFFRGDDGRWCVVDCCPYYSDFKGHEQKTCPVCQANSKLWQLGQKEEYRQRKARKSYVFNILVVDDKKEPENNGKVFLFKCSAEIYKKIVEAMNPTIVDEEMPAVRPFDLINGNNFNIRLRKDASKHMLTYDKSSFSTKVTPIAKSDAEIEAILGNLKDLNEYAKSKELTEEQILQKTTAAFANTMQNETVVSRPTESTSSTTTAVDPLPDDFGGEPTEPSEDKDLQEFKELLNS